MAFAPEFPATEAAQSPELSVHEQQLQIEASHYLFDSLRNEASEAIELLQRSGIEPDVLLRKGLDKEPVGWLMDCEYRADKQLAYGTVLGLDGNIYQTRKMIAARGVPEVQTADGQDRKPGIREVLLRNGASQLLRVYPPEDFHENNGATAPIVDEDEKRAFLDQQVQLQTAYRQYCKDIAVFIDTQDITLRAKLSTRIGKLMTRAFAKF